jgi:hypothetical protein
MQGPEQWEAAQKELSQKLVPVKHAMHGYPDYQMTDPTTSPLPQQSLPNYDPEEQEPQGLLSKIPGKAIGAGAMIGGFMGKGLVDEDLRKADQTINFLKGKPSPQLNSRLLQVLQSGLLPPEAIPEARKNLSSPQWLRENFLESPAAYDEALKNERMNYWKSMGKGPGLGMLGGALAGLGGGLLYNHLKESSVHGLLWKEARPGYMARPPSSQEIPDAWRNFKPRPSAFAATQVGPSPFEQTRMLEAPHAAPGATAMAKRPGLLSKLQQGATMVAKRRF